MKFRWMFLVLACTMVAPPAFVARASTPSAPVPDASLYQRLGGYDALR